MTYVLSDAPDRLDRDAVWRFLSTEAYWARWRSRADLERQIDVQVVTAVKAVTAARTRVALSERAISVAEDNVRIEKASFVAGKTSNFQVMQQQSQLIDARLARGRAIADYHEAVAQLQFLSGILLEQYRVNVRPHAEER